MSFQELTPEYQSKQPWWRVAKAYFDSHTLTEHQINSYNTFMREKLPGIITNGEFEYTKDNNTYICTFENVYVKKPEFTEPSGVIHKLVPQDCRARNLTYACRIYTDITRYTLDGEKVTDLNTFSNVFIGAIPCMVLSEYCNLYGTDENERFASCECQQDPGGYFIVKGSEKVLMSQDRMAHNEIFVFKSKDKDTIKLPSPGSDKNSSLPCGWSAEVRSYTRACEPNITSTYIKFSKQQLDKGEDSRLYVELPRLKAPVPWPIVMMALGVTDKNEIASYVCDINDIPMMALLMPSLDCPSITTQQDALDYLSNFVLTSQKDQRMSQLKKILRVDMYQNVTQTFMKRFYFGHMTQQLLATVLGRRKQDDRDHYGKKRVATAGNLINDLFKSVWKRIIREVITNLIKKRSSDLAQVFYGKITNYITPPFASGNWTATKSSNKASKVGISQLLNRHNYVSTISNLRRVITPNDKNSKIIKPRHLHNSQWCFLCPAETPEGQATGLIKNLAMLSTTSLGSLGDQIIDWLEMSKDLVKLLDGLTAPSEIICKVFVNGSWVGTTTTPEELVNKLRTLRRKGKISYEVSISLTKEGVRVYTDEGRVICPFFIVKNGKLKTLPETFEWRDLLDDGYIEYLDSAELETLKHATCPWDISKHDSHAMIHPCFMLGVSASTAPFPDHNQSPRNIYQAAMGKQALGVFAGNFLHRYDTTAHILCYPQLPLVDTQTMRMMGTHNLPSGQNLIVAVMSAAYNQEDSVILNKRAIDTGALRSICYNTYNESCHRKGNTIDEIKRPEKQYVKETRLKGYSKLDADGISKENTPLAKRDVVVGKVNSTTEMVRDISVIVKSNGLEENAVVELQRDDHRLYAVYHGSAVVDRAILTLNEDSCRTIKVRVRQMRIPQIGDKVASRSAQKGIIGMILPPENMPFSAKTGMTPDLLMNPNAFPSRMTMGQALESFLGKACSLNGEYADCTPFEPQFRKEIVANELARFGFEEYGDEVLIDGMTGEQILCKIFMGPTYYQRLKHMVDDKIHCLTPDHDVLTSAGWKPIAKVTVDDLVATLQDGMIIYDYPLRRWEYDYTGDMYVVQSQQVDLMVTMKHKMWCAKPFGRKKVWNYDFHKAQDILGKHVKYQKNGEWGCTDYQFVLPAAGKLDSLHVDMRAWLTIVGIWYAEGWVEYGKSNKRMIISDNKQRVKDAFHPALETLGIKYFRNAKVEKTYCIDIRVVEYLRPFSVGAVNKSLPEWVWKLSKMQSRHLIESMCLGDGSTSKNGSVSYYTSSMALADDVQRLVLHSGWSSNRWLWHPAGNTTFIDGRKVVSTTDHYRLSIVKTKNNPAVNHGHNTIQHDRIVQYTGKVHCLEVHGNTFYVRRNGKPVWTGNSRHQDGPRETLTRQPVEGRKRGGGFRMGEMETWCGISHGASWFLIDRLVNNSDGYEMFVCNYCGNTAIATLKTQRYECKRCEQNTAISKIRIPYAFKLLKQELQACGIGVWFNVNQQKTLVAATTPSH